MRLGIRVLFRPGRGLEEITERSHPGHVFLLLFVWGVVIAVESAGWGAYDRRIDTSFPIMAIGAAFWPVTLYLGLHLHALCTRAFLPSAAASDDDDRVSTFDLMGSLVWGAVPLIVLGLLSAVALHVIPDEVILHPDHGRALFTARWRVTLGVLLWALLLQTHAVAVRADVSHSRALYAVLAGYTVAIFLVSAYLAAADRIL